jgi:ADP-ribose pyrophosphatase YjhB (NUDIX family)
MLRGLALMLVESRKTGIDPPYVGIPNSTIQTMPSSVEEFEDVATGLHVTITFGTAPTVPRMEAQTLLEFTEDGLTDSPTRAPRIMLHEELGFPLAVSMSSNGITSQERLVQPGWLNAPYRVQDLSPVLGAGRKQPYTACNAIVIQDTTARGGDHEVLLTKRLVGSGKDTFALPGGKMEELDRGSVRACVIRELREEVGLEFRQGRLVSIRQTNLPGYPPVRSIGVLVTRWRGRPRRREHLAHSGWQWYPLTKLPSPLFEPSRLALDDYRNGVFPDLGWSDVEPDAPLPLWRRHD